MNESIKQLDRQDSNLIPIKAKQASKNINKLSETNNRSSYENDINYSTHINADVVVCIQQDKDKNMHCSSVSKIY
jgi:hypothetical protein